MTLICMKMNLLAELIFMWKISHLDLFWNRRTRELGDGLLLDDIFVIARVIKVSAGVISWSPRLRLITLTETLIILDITKTKSNNCFIIHWTKKWKSCFCFVTDGKQHKARKLDMIIVTLSVLDIIIVYIIAKSMHALWLVNQLWVIVSVNPRKNHAYNYHNCWAWYNGSYTMATKPIKFLELHYTMSQFLINRGYYTVARRYEFYFRVTKQYCFCHEKIKFISSSRRVMFFLLYRHADDGVFDDFPKLSEGFPNCSEYQTNVPEHFPRISEDVRRCPKIAKDFRGRPEDVSMIHQRI